MEVEIKNDGEKRKQGLRLVKEGLIILDENVFPYGTEGALLPILRTWVETFESELERNLIDEFREDLGKGEQGSCDG